MSSIQVGDLITSYFGIGYHTVTKVAEERIDYVRVMYDNGRPSDPTPGHAPSHLCTIINAEAIERLITEERMRLDLKRDNLLNILRKP